MNLQHQHCSNAAPDMTSEMMTPNALYVASSDDLQLQAPGSVITPAQGNTTLQTVPYQDIDLVATYPSARSRNLGYTLIVIGMLLSISGVIVIILDHFIFGLGSLTGILFIVAGKCGVTAANRRRCVIIKFMVLSILSLILAIIPLCFGAFGIMSALSFTSGTNSVYSAVVQAISMLLIIAAAVVSMWSSIMCCTDVCCSTNTYSGEQVMIIHQLPQQLEHPGEVQNSMQQGLPPSFPPPSSSSFYAGRQQFPQQQPIPTGYSSISTADEKPSGIIMSPVEPPPAYSQVDVVRS